MMLIPLWILLPCVLFLCHSFLPPCFNPQSLLSHAEFSVRNILPVKSNKYTLFMVRFSLNDPVTPVDLLQKNDPHELVRECHL